MNDTVYLLDPRSRLRIEYSRDAMEQIRRRAREGLMAAPRVGMGVGGLLIGVREEMRVRLLDSIEIPCSHSAGPSFNLTADEKRECRAMIEEAGGAGVSGKVGVIGWYCSKTRTDPTLSEADRQFYSEMFPGPFPIALIVRPSVADSMTAAFFSRDQNGMVAKAIECQVEEWLAESDASEAANEPGKNETPGEIMTDPAPLPPRVIEISAAPKVVEMASPAREVRIEERVRVIDAPNPAASRISDIAAPLTETSEIKNVLPVKPAKRPAAFGAPAFSAPRRPPRSTKRMILLITAAILVLLAGAALYTRDLWAPKPPLALTSTESNGTLTIHWNPDALRGIDHASLFVNDGGQPAPTLIPLDKFQLRAGLLSYPLKSKRVTAKLDAGEISGITAWFAPVTSPADVPIPGAPSPAPGSSEPAQTRSSVPAPDPHTLSNDKAKPPRP
jgi:proteasome lid subunit RPN8/RPN11